MPELVGLQVKRTTITRDVRNNHSDASLLCVLLRLPCAEISMARVERPRVPHREGGVGIVLLDQRRKKKKFLSKMLWCNKLAQGVFLTRVYKPLKKIAWLGSWGGESVRPGSTACLHRTWGTPDRNPRQYRDTCLRIQLSHNPHLPQFHVSTSDLFREAISAFDLWTLGGESTLWAEACFYRNAEHLLRVFIPSPHSSLCLLLCVRLWERSWTC